MNDWFTGDPFDREIAGLRGTVLVRRNADHTKLCVKAIRRRTPPAWSRHATEGMRVGQ
jgi:hypothetical protein